MAVALARIGVKGGGRPTDLHRADVYSLGLVLVEALTGIAPTIGPSRDPAGLARLRDGGTTAFADWSGLPIPAGLRPILAHCLAADPARRYADGRSLAEDLDRWRSDLPPITAPNAPWPVPMARWARRRRTPIAATGLTLVVAVVAATFTSSAFRTTARDQAAAKYARFLDKDAAGLFGIRQSVDWALAAGDPAELAARKLHPYDVLDGPDWRRRDDVRLLPEPDRTDLELLILEQVFRISSAWADRPDSPGDWSRALALLDRESRRARNPTYDALRGAIRSRRGEVAPAGTIRRRSGWPRGSRRIWRASPSRPARPATRSAISTGRSRRVPTCSGRAIGRPPSPTGWGCPRSAPAPPHPGRATAGEPGLAHATGQRVDLGEAARGGDRPGRSGDCHRPRVSSEAYQAPCPARRPADPRVAAPTPLGSRSSSASVVSPRPRNSSLHGPDPDSEPHPRRMFDQRGRQCPLTSDLVQKILAVDPSNADVPLCPGVPPRTVRPNAPRRSTVMRRSCRTHPDHLRARYGRVHGLLKLAKPGAVDEAARLVEDSRFEELYREDPRCAPDHSTG